jgi:AraC-like DNA-binding protein/TolB-like protein/Flp pilus assembly protein TadD
LEKLTSIDNQFLVLVSQIVDANLGNEHFSVEDLARRAGLSRSMLHRKLKKLTGKSAGDFITEIRLTRAKVLLENDAATVSEIAYRVGFTDPSYFTKVFKKHFKVLPGNVRKNITARKYQPDIQAIQATSDQIRTSTYKLLKRALVILMICSLPAVGAYYFLSKDRSGEKSLAVLPIKNFTGDPENTYFIDGMHDALIGELGQIESLRVISRTSTLRYRDSKMLLKDIARELGVNTIVEGSVMETEDSLKLLIQVIDVFPKESHVMVSEYQNDMQNALNILRSAVRDIAKNIGIRLSDEEKQLLTRSRTVNPETYKFYLQGMYYLNQGNPESFEKGIRYMLKAIDKDPGDPLAYACLALGYAVQGHGMVAPEGSFRSATAAAERALRIDPTLDEAYTALALINSYQTWDWPKVKDSFEKALANNPNNAIAHEHFAFYYVLFNDKEKAFYHANMAAALEPFSASYHAALAWFNYHYGDYDQAEIMAHKALELQEDIPYGNLVLGWIHIRKKQYQEAIALHKKLPVYADYYKMLIGYTYIQSGQREKAMALLNEMETAAEEKFINPVFRGMLAGMLGYTDRAFEFFNEACDHKTFPIIYIKVFPGIEHLKDDPRYSMLMQKLNLPV